MVQRQDNQPPNSNARFLTTRWSLVLAAGDKADSHCHEALQALCESYWYPLYAYARRQGQTAQDAEDLTQAFFVKLIERNLVSFADHSRGRFRSFLITAFKHFVGDQWDKTQTAKRGGQVQIYSLDFGAAETRYQHEPAHSITPEDIFERQWATLVLEVVFGQLCARYQAEDKGDLFEQLKGCLTQSGSAIPYDDFAIRLSLSKGATRVAVHRLRKRYRDLLRAEIAHTVADPAFVQDEIRHLFQVLAR